MLSSAERRRLAAVARGAPGATNGQPFDRIAYAYVGDCRFSMGRSLLVMGALMGSDVRLAGPEELHPPKDVVDIAEDIARWTGARMTVTADAAEAVSVSTSSTPTPTCGSRWASRRMSGPTGSGP